MSIKPYQWISVLVLLWLGLVIANTPAQWGIWLAKPPVQMDGVSGTIWSGRAANVVVPYPGGVYSLGQLQWQLAPSTLLSLSPCAQVSAGLDNQTLKGRVCRNVTGTLALSEVTANLPASVAELWAPVSVQGEVFLSVDQLRLKNNRLTLLEGRGSWTEARYHNSQRWMNIGDMGFQLAANDQGGINAQVNDLKGPMQLDLSADFNPDGSFDIRGDIVLRENAPQEIGQLLTIIATQQKPGHFRFEWVGS